MWGNYLGYHGNTRVDQSIFWVTLSHAIIIWTLFCLILKLKGKKIVKYYYTTITSRLLYRGGATGGVFTPKQIWASSAIFSLQEKSLHAGYALFGIDFMVQISRVKVYVPNSRSWIQIMMEKVKQTSMRCLPRELWWAWL